MCNMQFSKVGWKYRVKVPERQRRGIAPRRKRLRLAANRKRLFSETSDLYLRPTLRHQRASSSRFARITNFSKLFRFQSVFVDKLN